MIRGVRNNKLDVGDESEADYELRDNNALFSSHANSIPLASAVHGPRVFYGSRQLEQTQPLVTPESAFVRNMETNSGRSFDFILGEAMGAKRSKVHGTVHKVTPDEILIKTPEGTLESVELYNKFPGNRKSLTHNTPVVKPGDAVKPGDLLAPSNYTDSEGRMALGRNLRIGVAPYLGHTMDDAIVISQTAANKFLSDHAETVEQEADDSVTRGRNHYIALFPKKFKEDQLKAIGDDGLVKPGSVIQPGDPIMLQTRPRTFSSASEGVSRLSRSQRFVRKDAAKVWEGSAPAEVLDAVRTKDGGVKVLLRYQSPAKDGDKLALRHGAKAIISRVIPDDQMPRTEDGRPLEVLLNELSLPSRENAATFHELGLGKIVEKTGKPYVLPAFLPKGQTWDKFVESEMLKHGVEELERVYDPVAHKFLDNPIKVGNAHVLRLHHLAEGKMSSRGQASYDCFDNLTEVLTGRGWVAWPEVTDEDTFCTPEADLSTAGFEPPLRLVAYDFEGELLSYTSRHLDWAVTEGHRFLTRTAAGKMLYLTASELKDHSMVCVPQFGFTCVGGNPSKKLIKGTSSGRLLRNRSDFEIDFVDYARLLGWWVSEGSVQVHTGRVYIWQDKAVNGDNYEEIRVLLRRLFGKEPTSHKERGWRVDDYRLAEFLSSEVGRDCYSKRIPRDIITAGEEAVSAFLETYIKGDGCEGVYIKADGRKATNVIRQVGSSSIGLMDDLQELLMRQGKGLIYRSRGEAGKLMSATKGGKLYAKREFYGGAIHLARAWASVVPGKGCARYTGKWSALPYKGKVYCATTRTGLLVVRRNGKPCVTGNSNQQPAKGGGAGGGAQRVSGLEMNVLHSSGATGVQKESILLRGQRNPEYWAALRANRTPKQLDKPFVWHKFLALLNGTGVHAKEMGHGTLRLVPMTDRELERRGSVEVQNDGIVDLSDFTPKLGGLFDPTMVRDKRWGHVTLPFPVINPSYEDTVRTLLGLTQKEYDELLRAPKKIV